MLSNVCAPGNHDIDFSQLKNFAITEKMNVQSRAESYNLFNQVVFSPPNQVLTSGLPGPTLSTCGKCQSEDEEKKR